MNLIVEKIEDIDIELFQSHITNLQKQSPGLVHYWLLGEYIVVHIGKIFEEEEINRLISEDILRYASNSYSPLPPQKKAKYQALEDAIRVENQCMTLLQKESSVINIAKDLIASNQLSLINQEDSEINFERDVLKDYLSYDRLTGIISSNDHISSFNDFLYFYHKPLLEAKLLRKKDEDNRKKVCEMISGLDGFIESEFGAWSMAATRSNPQISTSLKMVASLASELRSKVEKESSNNNVIPTILSRLKEENIALKDRINDIQEASLLESKHPDSEYSKKMRILRAMYR